MDRTLGWKLTPAGKLLVPALTAMLTAAIMAGMALASGWSDQSRTHHGSKPHPYAIGLWGDLPYSDVQATTGVPNLIADTAYSFGQHHMRQDVQATPLCLAVSGPAPCVENRRWTVGGVTYATLNIQGSCNNLCDTAPNSAEYTARNQADIVWMQQTFDVAKQQHSAAVMLITQADPGFDASDVTRAPLRDPKTLAETDGQPDGYQSFLTALRDQVTSFKLPVAYVHGDSHYFRIDKPLLDSKGQRVENFTRVETFGDHQENGNNDVHWLKMQVDPSSREVFSYQNQIVPANRTAVPAA